MSTATIVIPCYNESRRLAVATFRRFAAEHDGVQFLLVNDGSQDETLSLLEQLRNQDAAHFAVLNLAKNGGKAEAVRQGVLAAAQGRPAYIGYWDADLATPLDSIPSFTAVLNRRCDIDLVVGSRMPLLGRSIRRHPVRRLIGRAFARLASAVLGEPIYDTQCGAKLFRATPEMLSAMAQPFRSTWIFDLEILARIVQFRRASGRQGLREFVYELPLDQWEDVAGSKLKKTDFARAVRELLGIWWHYLRPGAPAPSLSLPPAESATRRAA